MNAEENDVYNEGMEAFYEGLTENDNPYRQGTSLAQIWEEGLFDAEFAQ